MNNLKLEGVGQASCELQNLIVNNEERIKIDIEE